MKRYSTRRRVDRRIFSRTSRKTKSINVSATAMRGGVRL